MLRAGAEHGWRVNIAASPSLALRAYRQVPVVFDDPECSNRLAPFEERALIDRATPPGAEANATRRYLHKIARSAGELAARVRDACASYSTLADHDLVKLDLPRVAALIAGCLPTRLHFISYRNDAFDTHVQQVDPRQRMLT